jgi:hypothetical protein
MHATKVNLSKLLDKMRRKNRFDFAGRKFSHGETGSNDAEGCPPAHRT